MALSTGAGVVVAQSGSKDRVLVQFVGTRTVVYHVPAALPGSISYQEEEMSLKDRLLEVLDTNVELKSYAAAPYYWLPYNFGRGYALPPLAVTFEVTYVCNLKCEMCSQWQFRKTLPGQQYSREGELTTDEYRTLIDELAKAGTRKIGLTGGEPFVRKDLVEIISHINSRNIYSTVTTNGTLMKEKDVENILKTGLDHIVFSLDGPPGIHDEVRGVRGTYDRLIKSLHIFSRIRGELGLKKPWIRINHAISAQTSSHLSEIFDHLDGIDVDAVHFNYLFFTDAESEEKTNLILAQYLGTTKMEDQKLPDELKQVDVEKLHKQIALVADTSRKKQIRVHFSPPLRGDEIGRRFYDPNYTYVDKCFSPWFRGRVNPYGEVYPCSIDLLMGNIRDKGFMALWNGEKYRKFRKDLKAAGLFPVCKRCCALSDKVWGNLPRLTR